MTFSKKNSVADLVAEDMAGIMGSDEYRTVFAKPQPVVKEAAKKCKCAKDCKCWKKGSHDAGACKCMDKKASASERFQDAINSIASVSEVLDDLGFSKSASYALKTLEVMVVEASDSNNVDGPVDQRTGKPMPPLPADMKKVHSPEDVKERGTHYSKPEGKPREPGHFEFTEDMGMADGPVDQRTGKPMPPLPADMKKVHSPEDVKERGTHYSKPEGKPQPQPSTFDLGGASDGNVHGAYQSAIDVGIKDSSNMADDGNNAADFPKDEEGGEPGGEELRELLDALGLPSDESMTAEASQKKKIKSGSRRP